jgi:hypothetical protein
VLRWRKWHARRRLVAPLDEIHVDMAMFTSEVVYTSLVHHRVAAGQTGPDVLREGDRLQRWVALSNALEALLEVT